jgi:threonine 3-dehydrogenase
VGVDRDGAFADYVVLPATNVWIQPDDLEPDLGAVFDPLGNATHTALSFPLAGEDVLVTGAGPIGVMATAIARHVGARFVVVTDPSPFRLELARKSGADLVLDPTSGSLRDAMEELGMKEGFDVGLEMSGAPAAVDAMIGAMNHGGRIAMLGLPSDPYPIDWGKVITHMLTIKGIYGREMFDTWYAMASMLQTSAALRDAVRSVITHRFPAEEYAQAFAAVRSGECGKVILDWSDR